MDECCGWFAGNEMLTRLTYSIISVVGTGLSKTLSNQKITGNGRGEGALKLGADFAH